MASPQAPLPVVGLLAGRETRAGILAGRGPCADLPAPSGSRAGLPAHSEPRADLPSLPAASLQAAGLLYSLLQPSPTPRGSRGTSTDPPVPHLFLFDTPAFTGLPRPPVALLLPRGCLWFGGVHPEVRHRNL